MHIPRTRCLAFVSVSVLILFCGCGGPSAEQKQRTIIEQNSGKAKQRLQDYKAIYELVSVSAFPELDEEAKPLNLNFVEHVNTEESEFTPNKDVTAPPTILQTVAVSWID